MARRKAHNIKVRGDRLEKLDVTKMEVAIWLLAKGVVEDRTDRSQPAPRTDNSDDTTLSDRGTTGRKAA